MTIGTTTNRALGGEIRVGDLTVHRMGFGAMRITGNGVWGEPRDRSEAVRLLRHVVERGVDFIDTADSYGPYVSEDIIAEALAPYPEGLVIATKGGFVRPGPDRWVVDARPERLRECLEGSLRRLKLERIDLYQLHRIDPKVPVEETLGALTDLQREGKIRHIGISETDVDEYERCRCTAPIVSVQNLYNVEDRRSEDVLRACERDGVAFLPWYPLAGSGSPKHAALSRVAREHGATPAQIALAWLLARSPQMLPIPGTSSIAHFDENLAAAAIALTPEQTAALD
ncbi:MAG TPA: aldo/keto reductase [Candidatus Baltobacteraceae bacterium]|nr:aldo/keto reductase [Candidatus Baltobacteraceae bacterium]